MSDTSSTTPSHVGGHSVRDALDRGLFPVPSCVDCGRLHWYPRAYCPYCRSRQLTVELVSSRGRLDALIDVRRDFRGLSKVPGRLGFLNLEGAGVRIVAPVTERVPDRHAELRFRLVPTDDVAAFAIDLADDVRGRGRG